MDILKLTRLNNNYNHDWGKNGYSTDRALAVNVTYGQDRINFELQETDMTYIKEYPNETDYIKRLNEIIEEGFSFGAFENNKLTGVLVCELRKWNNTIYIEHFLVAEQYRRKGVGQMLVKKLIVQCESYKCRLIEAETQNTNLPVIRFYLKQGFKITGINLKLYAGDSGDEIAIFVTYDNSSLA